MARPVPSTFELIANIKCKRAASELACFTIEARVACTVAEAKVSCGRVMARTLIIAYLAHVFGTITQRAILAIPPMLALAKPRVVVTCAFTVALDSEASIFCSICGCLFVNVNDLLVALQECLRPRACPKLATHTMSAWVALAQTCCGVTCSLAIALVPIDQWACAKRAVLAIRFHKLECWCDHSCSTAALPRGVVACACVVTDKAPCAVGAMAH